MANVAFLFVGLFCLFCMDIILFCFLFFSFVRFCMYLHAIMIVARQYWSFFSMFHLFFFQKLDEAWLDSTFNNAAILGLN